MFGRQRGFRSRSYSEDRWATALDPLRQSSASLESIHIEDLEPPEHRISVLSAGAVEDVPPTGPGDAGAQCTMIRTPLLPPTSGRSSWSGYLLSNSNIEFPCFPESQEYVKEPASYWGFADTISELSFVDTDPPSPVSHHDLAIEQNGSNHTSFSSISSFCHAYTPDPLILAPETDSLYDFSGLDVVCPLSPWTPLPPVRVQNRDGDIRRLERARTGLRSALKRIRCAFTRSRSLSSHT